MNFFLSYQKLIRIYVLDWKLFLYFEVKTQKRFVISKLGKIRLKNNVCQS